MNPSRATIPLIRPLQCDSDGGRIRGVLQTSTVLRINILRLSRAKPGFTTSIITRALLRLERTMNLLCH